MTQCSSRVWVVCCSLVSAGALDHLTSLHVQDALHDRAFMTGGKSGADLQGATLGKPALLASPGKIEHKLGVAQISRGVATYAMRQPASFPGFRTGGASRNTFQRGMSAITQQHVNEVPAVLARAVVGHKNAETMPKAGAEKHVQDVESEDEFDSVLQSSELVMVEFTTPWCGPCKLFAPKYERMAADFSEKVSFLKVNMKKGGETWKLGTRFNVQAIPSFLFFQRGELVMQEAGIRSETKLRHAMSAACAASVPPKRLAPMST
eukprot:gnl/MRDRNA2_/MRDRNA2_101692_c0_seq1.p1 gnl/MRDRNA2_/MRDRNA2_101692_c0~~gnl/MRDRNA2_/MRDRNA2_101692_c0_seq1.p1  ORF type:complete len:264 (+),score=44.41 gnl/MRDRNA2_/MRDRNA2_101692_c0_seq1:95-886(+)